MTNRFQSLFDVLSEYLLSDATAPVASFAHLLTMGWLTTIIMLAADFWEGRLVRSRHEASKSHAGAH